MPIKARREGNMADVDWVRLEEIDWLFRKMVRKFVKERDKVTIEGITLPGLLILHKIIRDGEQKLSDLAEQLDLTSGAITALCDKLEEKGFAVRKRMAEDRRTVLLNITDTGREMFERNRNIGSRCFTILFDGFADKELDAQKQIYQQIIENLESFAETILDLAKENVEQHSSGPQSETKEQPTVKSSFLRY